MQGLILTMAVPTLQSKGPGSEQAGSKLLIPIPLSDMSRKCGDSHSIDDMLGFYVP